MGSIVHMDPKPPSRCWYISRPSPPSHRSKSCFQIWKAWTPLKLTLVQNITLVQNMKNIDSWPSNGPKLPSKYQLFHIYGHTFFGLKTQKVGPSDGTFKSIVISEKCFRKFRARIKITSRIDFIFVP